MQALPCHVWLLRRLDVTKLAVVHPGVDANVASLLRIPPLSDVIKERLVDDGARRELAVIQGRQLEAVRGVL